MSDIIFEDEQGNRITREDLANVTGKIDFSLIGRESVSFEAIEMHQMARQEGQYGRYSQAINLLNQSHQLAPDWPYPLYDLAYTYLLQKDFEQALAYYRLTNRLEPRGFFTCKTAIYALSGETEKLFPVGQYLHYLGIEWTNDEDEKLEIARNITEKTPNFAPAWKELANLLTDTTKRAEAIETGLLQKPDLETKGNLLINKALVLDMQDQTKEAIQVLGDLVLDSEVTLTNEAMGKFVLAQLASRK
ncbi:MAG TPA: hypothetical protein DCS93_08145 [Microscillaceae bacterium]|nr:hypothetical protein [Microscillaceae bacterium]